MAGSIYGELLTFSETLRPWQRDALRRHTEASVLSAADINELTDITFAAALGKADGLIDDETAFSLPVYRPLTAVHIPTNETTAPPIRLSKVTHIQGVNRLRPNAAVTLRPVGLNIIFGTNGTGKSGYGRILKRVCHSRGKEDILGDVFSLETLEPIAEVSYLLGDEEQSHQANLTLPSEDPNLARVAVYDSKSALQHIGRKGSTLTVTPEGLELLTNLVNTYNAVDAEAKSRIAVLMAQGAPGIVREATDAAVKEALSKLGTVGGYAAVEEISRLDETDLADLTSLPGSISNQKTSSKTIRLATAQGKVMQASNQAQRIRTLAEKVSAEQVSALRVLWNRLEAIKDEEAAQQKHDFTSEVVDGVMGARWFAMWSAAKDYAEAEAYPSGDFPAEDMPTCVLCHQPMSSEAHERLRRFSEAMAKDLAQEQRQKSTQAEQILSGIRLAVSGQSIDDPLLTILAEENAEAIEQLRTDIKTVNVLLVPLGEGVRDRRGAINNITMPFIEGSGINDGGDAPAPVFPVASRLAEAVIFLDKVTEAYEAEATGIQEESTDGSRLAAQEQRLLNLQHRQKLAGVLPEIKAHHNRLIHARALRTVASECVTTGLSNKAGVVCQDYVQKVSDDFRENLRFLDGVDTVEGSDPEVKVQLVAGRVSKGVSNIAFTIKGAASKTFADGILSEGEFRAVSLSAFFADVTSSGDGSAIIFDDPVTSMDAVYQAKVAKRLVKEARTRQVIVFTHNMPFVSALLHKGIEKDWHAQVDEGIENPVAVEHSLIELTKREDTGTGQQVGNAGTLKGSYSPLMQSLEGTLYQQAKAHYEAMDMEAYGWACQNFANNLRQAWEFAVEEFVLAGVVSRNQVGVSTVPLRALLTLQPADVVAVDRGMDVSSFHVHSTAEGNEQELPTPPELWQRCKDLRDWVKDYKQRRELTLKTYK